MGVWLCLVCKWFECVTVCGCLACVCGGVCACVGAPVSMFETSLSACVEFSAFSMCVWFECVCTVCGVYGSSVCLFVFFLLCVCMCVCCMCVSVCAWCM